MTIYESTNEDTLLWDASLMSLFEYMLFMRRHLRGTVISGLLIISSDISVILTLIELFTNFCDKNRSFHERKKKFHLTIQATFTIADF